MIIQSVVLVACVFVCVVLSNERVFGDFSFGWTVSTSRLDQARVRVRDILRQEPKE